MTQRKRAAFDLLWLPARARRMMCGVHTSIVQDAEISAVAAAMASILCPEYSPVTYKTFRVLGVLLGYMYWWFIVVKAMKVTLLAKGDIVNIHHELLLLSCQLPCSLFSFNNHSKTDANPDILERKKKIGRFLTLKDRASWVVQILSLWR